MERYREDNRLPDFRGWSSSGIITWIGNHGSDHKWMPWELRNSGFYEEVDGRYGAINSSGYIVLNRDSAGRLLVVEQNSDTIRSYEYSTTVRIVNLPDIARLKEFASPSTQIMPQKHANLDFTALAAGALAATQLVAGVAGKQIYPEKVIVSLNPVGALGDGASAKVTIQDDAGTPNVCGRGTISREDPKLVLERMDLTDASQDLDILVEAGLLNLDVSEITVEVLYREVT
jgi:hypothetical protein